MTEPMTLLALASTALAGLGIVLLAGLRGWQGWLELKRLELSAPGGREPRSPAMERIEIADLKERIRKLEAIASCVDP
jgi:hypothetical protein